MKSFIFIFLLVCFSPLHSYALYLRVGDIITPTSMAYSPPYCVHCSPTNRYVVTDLVTTSYNHVIANGISDAISKINVLPKYAQNGLDYVATIDPVAPLTGIITGPLTDIPLYYYVYRVEPVETFSVSADAYTVAPSLAIANATRSGGVITQTISFLVGAFTSMAFVIAAKRIT